MSNTNNDTKNVTNSRTLGGHPTHAPGVVPGGIAISPRVEKKEPG